MTVYANDKDSLKKAVDSKADIIIVTGKYAKNLKGLKAMKKARPAALAAAFTAIAAAVPTVIATLATAPETAGISFFIGVPAIAAEATVVSAELCVGIGVAVSLIILAATISVATLKALNKDYDVEIGADGKGGMKAILTKNKE